MFDFNVNQLENYCGDWLVHVVVRGGVCQLPVLLCLQHSYLADIDAQNRAGLTCLMIMAVEGDALMVDVSHNVLIADVRHDALMADESHNVLIVDVRHEALMVDETHDALNVYEINSLIC
jgi:hypothetical protein